MNFVVFLNKKTFSETISASILN